MKLRLKNSSLSLSVVTGVGIICGTLTSLFFLSSSKAYACTGVLGSLDPTCPGRILNPSNGGTSPSRIPTQVNTSSPGRFIRNMNSGRCIDVAGTPGSTNGARLILFDCEVSGRDPFNGATTDQRWVLTNDGFIRNTLSGRCIDVAGAPGQNNTAILQLWDCESSGRNRDNGTPTDQRWTFTSDGLIRNTLSGKCIDVDGIPGVNNGARLHLFDCEFSGRDPFRGAPTDQRWRLE